MFIKEMSKLVARQPEKRISIFGSSFIAFYVTLRLFVYQEVKFYDKKQKKIE